MYPSVQSVLLLPSRIPQNMGIAYSLVLKVFMDSEKRKKKEAKARNPVPHIASNMAPHFITRPLVRCYETLYLN